MLLNELYFTPVAKSNVEVVMIDDLSIRDSCVLSLVCIRYWSFALVTHLFIPIFKI